MGQREEASSNDVVSEIGCSVLTVICLVGFAVWILHASKSRDPDYTVSITGADGLDDLAAALSPVFNLTVRIDNAGNTHYRACVKGLSAAAVSYGDAFLAKGSVPPFCAEKREVQERAATAWGNDVVVPRFLRERLAGELARGEAVVDVQVTTPADCFKCSDTVLVCGKAKIGGDPAPCRRERVYPRPAPGAGWSTASA
ncbi:unnamed protein product [Urochloa decumbens]|uniref:Uncharacterized protein n=1 Tax=Urochloa decumbens TaxID=240449 RepID=A0ABC9D4Y0_9POAL